MSAGLIVTKPIQYAIVAVMGKSMGSMMRLSDSRKGIAGMGDPKVVARREAIMLTASGLMTYLTQRAIFERGFWKQAMTRSGLLKSHSVLVRGLMIAPVYLAAEKLARVLGYHGLSKKQETTTAAAKAPAETVLHSPKAGQGFFPNPLRLLNPFASFNSAEPAVQPSFGYAMLQYQAQPTAPALQATAPITGLYNTGLRLNQTI